MTQWQLISLQTQGLRQFDLIIIKVYWETYFKTLQIKVCKYLSTDIFTVYCSEIITP